MPRRGRGRPDEVAARVSAMQSATSEAAAIGRIVGMDCVAPGAWRRRSTSNAPLRRRSPVAWHVRLSTRRRCRQHRRRLPCRGDRRWRGRRDARHRVLLVGRGSGVGAGHERARRPEPRRLARSRGGELLQRVALRTAYVRKATNSAPGTASLSVCRSPVSPILSPRRYRGVRFHRRLASESQNR